ncbi:MAG TPA: cytochrome P450 [Pseudonocardiaceae bacterium]
MTDPAATERLLAAPGVAPDRRGLRTEVTDWGPDGPARWRAARQAMRPALTGDRVAEFLPAVVAETERLTARWPATGVITARHEATRLTAAVNTHLVLGPPTPATAAVSDLVSAELTLGARRPSWWRSSSRLLRAQRRTYAALRRLVRDTEPRALHAVLLDAGLDEHTVVLSLRTMLLSGHRVPAAALAWAWHELAEHPAAQSRADAEADEATGVAAPDAAVGGAEVGVAEAGVAEAGAAEAAAGVTDADGAATGVAGLPFCRAVLHEAMRLHPPVSYFQRLLTEPVTVAGHALPADALVRFTPAVNHRDPTAYADPDAFRPERWLGPPPRPGNYLPFALGPRICPGSGVALAELSTALATILTSHHLRPHRRPREPGPELPHSPRGLRLLVHRRRRGVSPP